MAGPVSHLRLRRPYGAPTHIVAQTYAFGAHTEHHPAAFTCLPGKIWQGRHSSPSAPCTRAQFAQVWPSVADACTYLSDCAVGSSSASCGRSSARASSPGFTRKLAAATADNWINWRLAILLNGLSLITFVQFVAPRRKRDAYINTKIGQTAVANGSHLRDRPGITQHSAST